VIRVYYDDHAPPQFHAIYGELESRIRDRHTRTDRREASEAGVGTRAGLGRTPPGGTARKLGEGVGAFANEADRSPGVSIYRVRNVRASGGYRLDVEFEDGVRGRVDLSDRLFGPVFEPLLDPEFFAQAGIGEFGAICRPDGADLAPDALHGILARQSGPPAVTTGQARKL
jgi:hypothetical protein